MSKNEPECPALYQSKIGGCPACYWAWEIQKIALLPGEIVLGEVS